MALTARTKVLIGVVLLVELILIAVGVMYRQSINRDFELVADEFFGYSAVLDTTLDPPSFPTSFESLWVPYGLKVVSTGEVSAYQMKDRQTGEILGNSIVLETVTRDRSDPQRLKRLPLIVQFSLVGDPSRNVMPWVLERAVKESSKNVTVGNKILSQDQISQIFPRGTIWGVAPLLYLNIEELGQLAEYLAYTRRYYGGSEYPNVARLMVESPDHHPLLGEPSIPIVVLDVPHYLSE
ncbi:hypothetical protein GTO10_05895 [Candidatus Saccharibacteria bacterium]|nr:hypothetical protein [Candidatus Saccharibacteria bacterium]